MGCLDCPRLCGAHREHGRMGRCGATQHVHVAYAMKHMWEEPCLSGESGSGTVFFSGCALGCVFCQNHDISRAVSGEALDAPQLAALFERVEAAGVHNINLVNGTHYTRALAAALRLRRPGVPVVWNSSGYELPETLALLDGLVQVYLPDLKYMNASAARRYADAADYTERAFAAIDEMYRQVGGCTIDAHGLLVKGLLVRHLILPGQTSAAVRVIAYVREQLPGAGLSMMAQYVPMDGARAMPDINRPISAKEYRIVENAMLMGAPDVAYMQQRAAADAAYVPPFGRRSPIPLQ